VITRLATGFQLAEAPVWDDAGSRLTFSDAQGGGVWSLEYPGHAPGAVPTCLIPHRRGIGGAALHDRGGLVVSGRNIAWKHADATDVLCELDPRWGLTRFNDLGTDHAGRIYAGSLEWADGGVKHPRPGYLHRISDEGCLIVDEGVGAANGVAVSPDDATLYFADTFRSVVYGYDHSADGALANRRVFASWPGGGTPDGLAVAADGTVWVALGSGDDAVAVVDPAGHEVTRHPVPGEHVTSVCFGGEDLTTLFVTTATSVFALEAGVAGLPVPRARVGPVREPGSP
jgi:xylono-1,5-lactonase